MNNLHDPLAGDRRHTLGRNDHVGRVGRTQAIPGSVEAEDKAFHSGGP